MTTHKSAVSSNLAVYDDLERAWDSGAAIKRIKDYASDEDGKIDFAKYRKAFFWVDPDQDDKQGGYKLPFADVTDGELKAVWRGVAAAMAALMGSRGGVSIPDSDKKPVYDQISKYYKKFDKDPPTFESEESASKDVEEERGEEEESEDEHDDSEKRYVKAFYDHKAKIAVASTDVEDRHGETIDQMGWDLKNFKNNDVMLWAHNHEKIMVGNCRNCRIDKSEGKPRLIFEPDFHDVTEEARALKILYEQGRMKTFSVGFLPTEFDGNRYTKQELLEISAVNVPANPDAMMLSYKSLVDKGFKKSTAKEISGISKQPDQEIMDLIDLVDEAVDMHQMHLDDPDTATPESQKELMGLLKKIQSILNKMGMEQKHLKYVLLKLMGAASKENDQLLEVFTAVRGAVSNEVEENEMQMQKMDKLKNVHEIYWAFCDVYHDEETPVDDFDKLLKELIALLGKVADGTYESPSDDEDNPEEPMPMDSKVLDNVANIRKDLDKINETVADLVKAQANKETSAAPSNTDKAAKVDRARQSLTKVIAKVSDDIFEAEKQGQKKADRVELLKVVKRAAEILSISQK